MVDWIRRHPLATAWIAIVVGLIGGLGNLFDGEIGAGLFGLALAAAGAGWIVRDRMLKARIESSRIAERAEQQHRMYLEGDDRGAYGQYVVPDELRRDEEL